MTDVDDPRRGRELERILARKRALRRLYQETYERYRACLDRCPKGGIALELGSGGGFVKDVVPEMITSDVIAYERVDQVVDATDMPFAGGSVRAICMLNVFHHIADVGAFLREAARVLVPGGRVLIVDQYPSLLSRPIYRWLHDEPFDERAREWSFESTGPLSGANGALAWIVFERDLCRFEAEHTELELARFQPHTPLRYWLSGGLKRWTLLPGFAFGLASWVDAGLARLSRQLCSFADIELVRRPGNSPS